MSGLCSIVVKMVLGVAGLAVVGWLVLRGVDPMAAQRSGSGWKRRLVTAALCLLAACGAGRAEGRPEGSLEPERSATSPGAASLPPWPWVAATPGDGVARADLDASPRWRAILRTWAEAEEIASGKKGEYPFTEAGKKRILAAIEKARVDAGLLAGDGLLSQAEAGLVGRDMATLASRVGAFRPTEMQAATCYEPMMVTPGRDSYRRLVERLPYLDKLAASGGVHAQVLSKVSVGIERDLQVLSSERNFNQMSPEEIQQAKRIAAQVRQRLEQIRKKSSQRLERVAWTGGEGVVGDVPSSEPLDRSLLAGPPALQDSEAWKRVTRTWAEADEVASGRKGAYPFDAAGKDRLLKALETAKKDVDALRSQQLVTGPEAQLLQADLAHLTTGVQRMRPTELREATCYKPMMFMPARDALSRLSQRAPILEKMTSSGVVHREVLRRVAATMRADLALLEKHEATLTGADRSRAAALRKEIRARLELLEKRAGGKTGAEGPARSEA